MLLLLVGRAAHDHSDHGNTAGHHVHFLLQGCFQRIFPRIGNDAALFKLQNVPVRGRLDHAHIFHNICKARGFPVVVPRILLDKLCELLQFFFTHDSHKRTSDNFRTHCSVIISWQRRVVNRFSELFVSLCFFLCFLRRRF